MKQINLRKNKLPFIFYVSHALNFDQLCVRFFQKFQNKSENNQYNILANENQLKLNQNFNTKAKSNCAEISVCMIHKGD